MIKSFRSVEIERLYRGEVSRRLPSDIQKVARRKLWMIDAAVTLEDLRVPPANRLEKLSGNRKGYYGLRINDQWRICFSWHQGDAYEVEIVDYHN